MRNPESGFSLLEVMAAFSLLIILFIPLVRASIDGLRSEGDSRRRMEASMLADNALAEIESGIVIGLVPPVGDTPWEELEFHGITSVTSFDPTILDAKPGPTNERPRAGNTGPGGDAEAPESIFPGPGSNEASPLRKIEIVVSWYEDGEPDPDDPDTEPRNRVVRTTYAFDLNSVKHLLGATGTAGLEEQADALGDLLP